LRLSLTLSLQQRRRRVEPVGHREVFSDGESLRLGGVDRVEGLLFGEAQFVCAAAGHRRGVV
jgi:hypothetical protein